MEMHHYSRTHLTKALNGQLQKIADTHSGKVPLHGRLFAQWMHYAFPRECPFPHRSGTAISQTPDEFGASFAATTEEMQKHAQLANSAMKMDTAEKLSEDEKLGMSQWMDDEELLTDYVELQRYSGGTSLFIIVSLFGLLALFAGTSHGSSKNLFSGDIFKLNGKVGVGSGTLPFAKQHLV